MAKKKVVPKPKARDIEFSSHVMMLTDSAWGKFRETKNPWFAWREYAECQVKNLPVPEEVSSYLAGVADVISKIVSNPNPPKPKDVPVEVGKALGLYRRSKLKECRNFLKERAIARRACECVKRWGKGKADYAFEEVAVKYVLSKKTVERYYKKHPEVWKE